MNATLRSSLINQTPVVTKAASWPVGPTKVLSAIRKTAGILSILIVCTAAEATILSTDAWDVSQGTSVTSTTGTHPAGSASGMFGNDAGAGSPFPVERLNTLFRDLAPIGTVHAIEWQSTTPITLTGYHLLANEDHTNDGRSFSSFRLFANVSGSFQLLSEITVKSDAINLYDTTHLLDLTQSVTLTTAQIFRAEFVQFSGTHGQSGPRVGELDAITAVPVPAPATVWLFISGLFVLAGCLCARSRIHTCQETPSS